MSRKTKESGSKPIYEAREYMMEDDKSPYSDWLKGLRDARAQAKVTAAVHKMRQGNFGDHKGVGEGVMEYRLTHGPGYRIYYALDGKTLIILLFGGTKERQDNDIGTAKSYWADYQSRKEEKH